MFSGKVIAVVGGQYGSEGKGAIAGYLGKEAGDQLAAVRVAGPNAGHTAYDDQGRRWALRQIPVVAVTNLNAKLVIGAGSEIDTEVLLDEIDKLEGADIPVLNRLFVDETATVLEHSGFAAEKELVTKIGSTGKGVGAARSARILREAPMWRDVCEDLGVPQLKVPSDTAHMLAAWLRAGRDVLLEGTQGFGLGLHAGFYPYCTSSDCRAVDFLAMAGITPWAPWVAAVEVWVCLRTYPIRVAGPSGPMKGEVTWDDLADVTGGYIRPEYTTVTGKMRRVGKWDWELASRAVAENGGPNVNVALTFLDYWHPSIARERDVAGVNRDAWASVNAVADQVGAPVKLLGTGPASVVDLRQHRG